MANSKKSTVERSTKGTVPGINVRSYLFFINLRKSKQTRETNTCVQNCDVASSFDGKKKKSVQIRNLTKIYSILEKARTILNSKVYKEKHEWGKRAGNNPNAIKSFHCYKTVLTIY